MSSDQNESVYRTFSLYIKSFLRFQTPNIHVEPFSIVFHSFGLKLVSKCLLDTESCAWIFLVLLLFFRRFCVDF